MGALYRKAEEMYEEKLQKEKEDKERPCTCSQCNIELHRKEVWIEKYVRTNEKQWYEEVGEILKRTK